MIILESNDTKVSNFLFSTKHFEGFFFENLNKNLKKANLYPNANSQKQSDSIWTENQKKKGKGE